ncbi:MAG: hypothetical protein FH749_02550 [Firmicutes bacterium]|nr:hypothetical protein [Bacillota bacterium]
MTKLFFDTDCISSFLWVREERILLNLYPRRIVLPQEVFNELSNPSIPHIKRQVDKLIADGHITTQRIFTDTEEFQLYNQLAIAPPAGDIVIGKGEASAIALAKVHRGILASNNLSDITKYVEKYQLNHITTADILIDAYNNGFISENHGNQIWRNMLAKKRRLPAASLSDYCKAHR